MSGFWMGGEIFFIVACSFLHYIIVCSAFAANFTACYMGQVHVCECVPWDDDAGWHITLCYMKLSQKGAECRTSVSLTQDTTLPLKQGSLALSSDISSLTTLWRTHTCAHTHTQTHIHTEQLETLWELWAHALIYLQKLKHTESMSRSNSGIFHLVLHC